MDESATMLAVYEREDQRLCAAWQYACRNLDGHERAVRYAAYEANHNLLLAARVESLQDKERGCDGNEH